MRHTPELLYPRWIHIKLDGWVVGCQKLDGEGLPSDVRAASKKIGSTITIKYKCHYAFFHRLQVQKRTPPYRDLGPSSEATHFRSTIGSAAPLAGPPLVTFLPVRSVGKKSKRRRRKSKGVGRVCGSLSRPRWRVRIPSTQPTNQPASSCHRPRRTEPARRRPAPLFPCACFPSFTSADKQQQEEQERQTPALGTRCQGTVALVRRHLTSSLRRADGGRRTCGSSN
jgi:hypothetical protein